MHSEQVKAIHPVCYSCTVPDVTDHLRWQLTSVLEEKVGYADPEVVDRWCGNIRRLKQIQGARDYSEAKHGVVAFRNAVVADIRRSLVTTAA